MATYNVGDKVIYLDPARVYKVTAVGANNTYTIQLANTALTATSNVPDESLRPASYAVNDQVEYLGSSSVYVVTGADNAAGTCYIQANGDQPIGPVPDGLIRPH